MFSSPIVRVALEGDVKDESHVDSDETSLGQGSKQLNKQKGKKVAAVAAAGTLRRTSHPKTRSGCLTCKKRRVKCDERFPICARCEKFGVTCDGYLHRPANNEIVKRPEVLIRPDPDYRKRAAISPENEVKRLRFGNESEMRYFRLFCEKTAFDLSGFYDPVIWGKIVLQAAENEDAIRHAVISIGALDMTAAMMRDQKSRNAREHHLFALKQYSKAIKDMRSMIERQNESHDVHTALVASVVIVCFETYHGNYASAAQQIRTGVRLIEDQKRKPGAPAIEEDLLHAFDRLDIQSMSHSDPWPLDQHVKLKDVYTHRREDLPPAFLDLQTARNYFNFIARRACHFASTAWKLERMAGEKPSHSWWDPSQPDWRAGLMEEHAMFVGLCEQWMGSFWPIYHNAREVSKEPKPWAKDALAPFAMRNYYLFMNLALRHFQDVDETAWDKSMPEFVEMLENGEILLANQEPVPFSFDLQNVWPLDVIARKCRNSTMRRRAIELLKHKPRREGIWDSVVAAIVCEWVVGVEEEGMLEGGFIPESARARNIGVNLDPENKKATVWCFLPLGETENSELAKKESRPLRKREAVLEWSH